MTNGLHAVSLRFLQTRLRTVKVMDVQEEVGACREPSTLTPTFISFTAPTCDLSTTIHHGGFCYLQPDTLFFRTLIST